MTLDTVFEQEFSKIVDVRVAKMLSNLAERQAVPDFADYSFRIGAIMALRDLVPDMLDETNDIISKR